MEDSSSSEQQQKQKPRRRSRLIVRLGGLLVSHSLLVSWVCCTVGIVSLLLLPILAKNTYISENALMPGSANPLFSVQHSQEAERLIKTLIGQNSLNGSEIPRLITEHMAEVGAEVYYHRFNPQKSNFHPVNFFSSSIGSGPILGNNCTTGINSVGIIRAPRGDGKESIVLVTPYNSQKNELSDAVSLGLGFAIFSLLSKVTWLSKDIVWLASDSQFGEHASVTAWLNDYHSPDFSHEFKNVATSMCTEIYASDRWRSSDFERGISGDFRRAGTMAAGLVIKVVDKKEASDIVTIYSEASNGQMPNLDLVNIVHYLAVHRQSFHAKIRSINALRSFSWLHILGRFLESLSKIAASLNSKWNFGIPASDYVEGTATLASSIYTQALGVPTGPHGTFRDYQVDAITLEISPRIPLHKDLGQSTILIRGGRLIEGVVRSVNNLLEKFHQSFFLYLLTSPNKFISVGVYMIAFAMLVAPLPIVAASLFSNDNQITVSRSNSSEKPNPTTDGSGNAVEAWRWVHAAKVALAVHLWAVLVALLPCLIIHIHDNSPMNSVLAWVLLSLILLLFCYLSLGTPYSSSQPTDWRLLKAVMIAAASIGLCLMSIINFATALIGTFFIIPMCLVVKPLRRSQLHLLSMFNIVMGIVGFLPATVIILESVTKGYEKASIADLWQWASLLWSWNSATYLYMFLIYLPCWLLFMLVLLHP